MERCFVVCTLSMVILVQLVSGKFCEVDKHEFYERQSGLCLKCDRCPLGLGRAGKEKIDFEIDPVHGALGCLECTACVPGLTYSNSISHKECRLCRNCTEEGLKERAPCTAKRNARCRKPKNIALVKPLIQTPTTKKDSSPNKPNQGSEMDQKKTIFGVSAAIVLVIVPAIAVVVVMKVRRTQCRHRNLRLSRGLPGEDIQMIIRSPPDRNSTQNDLEYDASPGTSSSTIYPQHELQQHISEEMLREIERYKDRTPTEKELTKFSKFIATKCMFCEIGRLLGLGTNDIDLIKEENTSLKEQAFRTLLKWKTSRGRNAKYKDLFDALCQYKENRNIISELTAILHIPSDQNE